MDKERRRTFLAPAKINLCLHVLGRRTDGYHDLAMVMQRVSLYDRVELALSEHPGVRASCPGLVLPEGGENIAASAARLLLKRVGSASGVDILVEKNIPAAAGLGGGSSDAAAVLMGLNEMLGAGLTREELMAMGGELGADVPFFIFQDAAWATGVGDVLEKLPGLPPVWYVLVNPGISVSTAWVYRNLGLTSTGGVAKMPRFFRTSGELVRLLHNDLERVTIARHPQVAEIKGRLLDLGAEGSLMSGSGPTVFGVFASEGAAQGALEALGQTPGWRTFGVRPL
ncbi:4-(cytidine 5'-diphospho)-2-C-methyl-D-erythritol kinase [Desulfuromonas sp.]|uniref:4-(cytidine 5'-diphospho)-2-C-methyl-D-erythritol kinase n=1 Tax=Desulfuromonas sp. TaxID=892 RepID=UPI0025C645A6|nr:4-(cytidine 5'-diphospho)-2-C-methyl-D-erythritol kinase [Desulfuromonas sp.]